MVNLSEIYILDKNFNRIDLIEGVNSFIWTERYNSHGDFILRVPISRFPYNALQVGFYLNNPGSNYLGIIDTVLRKRDSGTSDDYIEVKGRFSEAFLFERVVTPNVAQDYWTLTGTVGYIATELVRRICIVGEYTTNDIIPNLTHAEQDSSTVTRTVKLKPTDVYTAVKELCDEDRLGFRIFFNYSTKQLEFRVYRGTDRSTTQSTNSKVVFSSDLDTLVNGSFLKSSANYKNIAYVKSKGVIRRVQIENGTFTGLNRRVLWVDASDIENPTNELLDNRGRLELAQHKFTNMVDGEIEKDGPYRYGVDYSLGDVVSLKSEDGTYVRARIVEYITTYDNDGIRSYPSFVTI